MNTRKIGTYELLELLGEGGIGQVYAARDTVLGRQVAIKTLRPELSRDRNFITRFYNEAQSLGDLGHTNITTLHALHLEGREAFMVMELVRGRTLEAILERVHRIPMRDSLAVVAQAVAGLAYAHHRGVIHRDIKPPNLMVTDSGLLKIMDFGIARVRGTQRLTRAGQMFGTLLYASPEQIRGHDVDERSDIYSLAVVLYEMLVGSPPFTAENEHALMTAHLEAPPPALTGRLRDLDARVEPAVMRALAKRPEERFASVEEFGRAVGAAAVRGDAEDILQGFMRSAFRNTPQTRFIGAHGRADPGGRGARPDAGAFDRAPGRGRVRPRLRAAMRSPVTLLGVVVVTLSLGLGYLVLGSKRPTQADSQIAMLAPPKPTPPAPPPTAVPSPTAAPSPTARLEPARLPQPAVQAPEAPSAEADTTKPTRPPSVGPTPPVASSPAPVIFQPDGKPENAPTLLPLTPTAKQPSIAPSSTQPEPEPALALLRPPPPRPDIQGTVSAVESTSRIRVGDHWIDLYGIDDPTQRVHTQDMLAYLKPSRGIVECYQKNGQRYQCYADGKDLAVLALRSGLARPMSDAPAEYRTLPASPAPARH